MDFGLAKSSSSIEEQAVDLYVLERALESTHPNLRPEFLEQLLHTYGTTTTTRISTSTSTNIEGQREHTTKKSSQTTLDRLEQVRMRGRKRECFG